MQFGGGSVGGDVRDVAMGFSSHSKGEAIVKDATHILRLALPEMLLPCPRSGCVVPWKF